MYQIKTYPDKPFICLMKSGMVYHLTEEQYPIVAQAWMERQVMEIPNYVDPANNTVRTVKIDGFHIETVDQAAYAQEQHWLKQGGFVCKLRTFHNRNDICECHPKPNYGGQKDFSTGTFADISAETASENMDSLRAGMVKRQEEIEEMYNSIEHNIKSHGEEWCRTNRVNWREKSKPSGAIIDFYALFQLNYPSRFNTAVSWYEKEQNKVIEPQAVPLPF